MTAPKKKNLFSKKLPICRFNLIREEKERILSQFLECNLALRFPLVELWRRIVRDTNTVVFTAEECMCLPILIFNGVDTEHRALLEPPYIRCAFRLLRDNGDEESVKYFLQRYLGVNSVEEQEEEFLRGWHALAESFDCLKQPFLEGMFERDPKRWFELQRLANSKIEPFSEIYQSCIENAFPSEGWFYNEVCVEGYVRYQSWFATLLDQPQEVERLFEVLHHDLISSSGMPAQPLRLRRLFKHLLAPLDLQKRTKVPCEAFQVAFQHFVECLLGKKEEGHYADIWDAVQPILENWKVGRNLPEVFKFLAEFDHARSGEYADQWKNRSNFWTKLWSFGYIVNMTVYLADSPWVSKTVSRSKIFKRIDMDKNSSLILFELIDGIFVVEKTNNGKVRVYDKVPSWTHMYSLSYSRHIVKGDPPVDAYAHHPTTWRERLFSSLNRLLSRPLPDVVLREGDNQRFS